MKCNFRISQPAMQGQEVHMLYFSDIIHNNLRGYNNKYCLLQNLRAKIISMKKKTLLT